MPNSGSQKRGERLQLMLTADEIEAVDNWRFERRMPSRSAAVRALMNLGFQHDEGGVPNGQMSGVASGDVGVIESDPRVEEVLGVDEKGADVLVLGTSLILAHALKNILADNGVAAHGPVTDLSDAEDLLGETSFTAVIFAVREGDPSLDGLPKALRSGDVPLLVCAAEEDLEALRGSLESAHFLSHASAPENLFSTLTSMRDPDASDG